MKASEVVSYQDAITLATQDLHHRCEIEIDLLWDDGTWHIADSMHKVKVWNGLGSIEYLISHRDLLERGEPYSRFLEDLSAAVNQRLTLRP